MARVRASRSLRNSQVDKPNPITNVAATIAAAANATLFLLTIF
jgi:hypothetical protein